MLPNSGFNTYGYNDVRGFKKKNRPLRLLQRYAPVLAVFELVLLLIVILTYQSSIKYGNTRHTAMQTKSDAQAAENRNLMSSLSQERQSRISVEARLREATAKTAALEKEMQNSRAVSDEKSQHYTSLQQSFETTRLALESERDSAQYEVRALNDRISALQHSMATLDRSAMERDRQSTMKSQEKDRTHAEKEASWESMRRSLEAQIKAQGGYVDPSYQQDAGVVHPDYAAKTGNQAFHPSLEGRKERFIDTAEALERDGISDPAGREHLATLLGHLYDLKLHEYAAIEKTHPGQAPSRPPPIGHWMAQNLERVGVTCKYGTVHMAYVLDRHFSLDPSPSIVGRGDIEVQPQAGVDAQAQGQDTATLQDSMKSSPPVPQGTAFGRASMGNQGLDSGPNKPDMDAVKAARDRFEGEKEALHAWRTKHHKVDSAGFV